MNPLEMQIRGCQLLIPQRRISNILTDKIKVTIKLFDEVSCIKNATIWKLTTQWSSFTIVFHIHVGPTFLQLKFMVIKIIFDIWQCVKYRYIIRCDEAKSTEMHFLRLSAALFF